MAKEPKGKTRDRSPSARGLVREVEMRQRQKEDPIDCVRSPALADDGGALPPHDSRRTGSPSNPRWTIRVGTNMAAFDTTGEILSEVRDGDRTEYVVALEPVAQDDTPD